MSMVVFLEDWPKSDKSSHRSFVDMCATVKNPVSSKVPSMIPTDQGIIGAPLHTQSDSEIPPPHHLWFPKSRCGVPACNMAWELWGRRTTPLLSHGKIPRGESERAECDEGIRLQAMLDVLPWKDQPPFANNSLLGTAFQLHALPRHFISPLRYG